MNLSLLQMSIMSTHDAYIIYNTKEDKFLNIIHEAAWVNMADLAYIFESPKEVFSTVGTLIGRYKRNEMMNIIKQMGSCVIVPVKFGGELGIVAEVYYDQYLELEDIRNG